jgi:hypothetical protein
MKTKETSTAKANNKQVMDLLNDIKAIEKANAKDLLTLDEVCLIYDIDKARLQNLVRRHEISVRKDVDGRLYVSKRDLQSTYIKPEWLSIEEVSQLKFD